MLTLENTSMSQLSPFLRHLKSIEVIVYEYYKRYYSTITGRGFVWKRVFIRDPLEITFSVLLILACLGVIIL